MGVSSSQAAAFVCIASVAAHAVQFNRADKIKANKVKVAKQQSRNQFKQQTLPSTKAHTPTLTTAAMKKKRLTDFRRLNGDLDVLQFFIRRSNNGPWSCFEEISADGSLQVLSEDIISSGGLQAEILRKDLEEQLSKRLFGKNLSNGNRADDNETLSDVEDQKYDMREIERMVKSAEASREALVKRAKEALPAFRKVPSRKLQFGYRILAEAEAIYPLNYSKWLGVDYDDGTGAFFWDDGKGSSGPGSESVPRIDMDKVLKYPAAVHLDDDGSSSMKLGKAIDDFVARVLAQRTKGEGEISRVLVDMQSPLVQSVMPQSQNCEDDNSFDLYICSDGSAYLQQGECTEASAGLYALCVSPQGSIESLSVHISDVAGFVLSPFDAELAGSLAATILCRRVVGELKARSGLGRVTFLTDSKTLTRSLRMGPTSNQFTERSTPSRLAAWDAIMNNIDELVEEGHAASVRWVPGHPERRHVHVRDWTYLDGAIFAADRLAGKQSGVYDGNKEEEEYADVWTALGVDWASHELTEIQFLELVLKMM